jgi:hypothetical protein
MLCLADGHAQAVMKLGFQPQKNSAALFARFDDVQGRQVTKQDAACRIRPVPVSREPMPVSFSRRQKIRKKTRSNAFDIAKKNPSQGNHA